LGNKLIKNNTVVAHHYWALSAVQEINLKACA